VPIPVQTFRGYHSIAEVIERLQPLGDWLRTHRRACGVLTLRRRDLDLLQRWPQAAHLHGITTTNGITWWRGFELRADPSASRYAKTQDAPHD
jgi:hypothetical protein